ncbi:hypothetical protein CAPN001_13360 [Capnocytophaga stomatis]|uniref:SMI1/KNR4 family protein n=1 Tax=Capnocytophaga stomatis TaxID=1848904 RepID=UPI00194FDC32|nr:SMI1/KNR4 family protein [Capnocytophaga stomatis]GIJ96767.1 hypothetical protein CAPN001_13360 [Capnocytophaga stomatis]
MKIKFEKYGLSPEKLEYMKHFNLKLDKRTTRNLINAYQTAEISTEMICKLEEKINFNLPKDYFDFLLKQNGGIPSKSRIKSKVIDHFLSLKSDYKYNSIVDLLEEFVSKGLPIATDPSGNYFLMKNDGKIYYFDHNSGEIDEKLGVLAENFTDLLENLK